MEKENSNKKKGTFDQAYLDSLKNEDFELKDMITQEDIDALSEPTNFLDESAEAWRFMTPEEKEVAEEFDAAFEN